MHTDNIFGPPPPPPVPACCMYSDGQDIAAMEEEKEQLKKRLERMKKKVFVLLFQHEYMRLCIAIFFAVKRKYFMEKMTNRAAGHAGGP